MGFGILLIGYFITFAFTLSKYYFFADIIGACIMIYAFTKLDQYNRYFSRAAVSAIVFTLLCALSASSLMFGIYDPAGSIDMAVDIAKQLAVCVMHVFVFLGTMGIAANADSEKLVQNARRNFIMTMVYYTFSVAVLALSPVLADKIQYLSAVVYLYWLACLFMNLVLLYKCFGILCPAEEDENEVKRSRFAIINKIEDKMDSFEKKSQQYREESIRMAIDEADRRAAEKAKKKKHQHHHSKKKK